MGDTYGRSPGMLDVSDAKVLQNAQRTTMTWEHLRLARDTYERARARADGPRQTPLDYELVPGSGRLSGLWIVVVPPALPRRLTWAQRLLSWPWQPWVTHTTAPNPYQPSPGYYWRYGDTLYCRQEDYQALKEAARRAP